MQTKTLDSLLGREAAQHLVDLRRALHRVPEVGLDCPQTLALIEEELDRLGFTERRRFAGGTAVLVRGTRPGRALGFRADIDALPSAEETGVPYQSTVPNVAHLCGHDGHAAGLLAFAHWLRQNPDFPGSALLIFQPGEEGFAGAKHMMDAGLFEVYPVEEVYAVHGAPTTPAGALTFVRGAMTASVDTVHITVEGRGGHGARPHQTVDPIPAACQLVLALQTVVSRNVNPLDSAVFSVCALSAGDHLAPSVVPPRVEVTGTVRSQSPVVRELLAKRCSEICEGIGLQTGTRVTLDYQYLYPPQINDKTLFDALLPALQDAFGADGVDTETPGGMGGEDFAFMGEKIPSLYIRVGLGDEHHQALLHNPKFDFNDAGLAHALVVFRTILEHRAV